ncbi:hypothetical protein [Fischerella sp. PCC 9605]|uniref:hypothetical protein n=1 Tax=Fischerella sp. PCC 9605 TaxID=1173024 RepID=UPI00047C0766|nr:hypothetical protein [Fischerella sp. PCC 9605]
MLFAIAPVKEALALLLAGVKTQLLPVHASEKSSGAKGKNVVTTDVSRWFTWARKHPSSDRPPHKQWCIRLHSLVVDVHACDAAVSVVGVRRAIAPHKSADLTPVWTR